MTGTGSDLAPTAYVCDHDQLARSVLRQAAETHGFELVGDASTAIEALDRTQHLRPELVLMRYELPGVSGLEATRDLRDRADPPEVILLALDQAVAATAKAAGAFATVRPDDVEGLAAALDLVRAQLDTGQRARSGGDRRSGTDRRVEQDWSKVFSERRKGADRRRGPRREADSTDPTDSTDRSDAED